MSASAPIHRKRTATERAVESVAVPPVVGPQATALLNQLTDQRVTYPQFNDVFDESVTTELGKGVQGMVVKTRILAASAIRFPPHINTTDYYAVKLQNGNEDNIAECRREARISLYIAQIEAPLPNVANTMFFTRLTDTADTTDQFCMVMQFVGGGTLKHVLREIETDDKYWNDANTLQAALAACLVQIFGGICEVRAGGIRDFEHGDLHEKNVLRYKVTGRACIVFDVGEQGLYVISPTWFCTDGQLSITDFGFSSGSIGAGADTQTVQRSPLAQRDSKKLCHRILWTVSDYVKTVGGHLKVALEEIAQLILIAGQMDATMRRNYDLQHLLAECRADMANNDTSIESALVRQTARGTPGPYRVIADFVIDTYTALAQIPATRLRAAASLATFTPLISQAGSHMHARFAVFEELAFLCNADRPPLELLRSDPFFRQMRVGANNMDELKATVGYFFLNNDAAQLAAVEFLPPIQLAPASPGIVAPVAARLSCPLDVPEHSCRRRPDDGRTPPY